MRRRRRRAWSPGSTRRPGVAGKAPILFDRAQFLYRRDGRRPGPAGRDRALSDAHRARRISAAAARRQCGGAADAHGDRGRLRRPTARRRALRGGAGGARADRGASCRRRADEASTPRRLAALPGNRRRRADRAGAGAGRRPRRLCSRRRSRTIATRLMSRGSRRRSRGCASDEAVRLPADLDYAAHSRPLERDGRAAGRRAAGDARAPRRASAASPRPRWPRSSSTRRRKAA